MAYGATLCLAFLHVHHCLSVSDVRRLSRLFQLSPDPSCRPWDSKAKRIHSPSSDWPQEPVTNPVGTMPLDARDVSVTANVNWHEDLGSVNVRTVDPRAILLTGELQANCNKSHIGHESKWGQDCIFFPWQRHFTISRDEDWERADFSALVGSKLKSHRCEDLNIIYNL